MDKGKQIAVGDLLRGIGEFGGHSIAVREFYRSCFIAEFGEPGTQRVTAGMLSENKPAARHSYFFGQNNFVGERIFQDAVLVNAGFVSECVGADDGFIGRDGDSRDRREQAAGGIDFLEANIRRGAEMALADVKRYCDFFERSISSAFADSVDRAFHLAGARGNRGE